MTALATTEKTPIMLTSHTYLNLDGFQNPDTALALNHTLSMPSARRRTATDSISIPTGEILTNEEHGSFDFWSEAKQIGADVQSTQGACGFNCTGYDTCFVFDDNQPGGTSNDWKRTPVATLACSFSGINLDIYTNQHAMQLYSCNNMNGMII